MPVADPLPLFPINIQLFLVEMDSFAVQSPSVLGLLVTSLMRASTEDENTRAPDQSVGRGPATVVTTAAAPPPELEQVPAGGDLPAVLPGARGEEERDDGALEEQNGVPVTGNEHTLTGALVAQTRRFTQDSPRDSYPPAANGWR